MFRDLRVYLITSCLINYRMNNDMTFTPRLLPGELYSTKIDRLDCSYSGKALVLMLGDCQIDEGVQPAKLLSYPDTGPEVVNAIGGLDVREFKDGVLLLVSSELVEHQFGKVWLIQKYLVHALCKYIFFPMLDTSTPDPYQVGGDKGPLASLVYELNKLDNLPALARFPRADTLNGALPPMPVLLLNPGGSLEAISPHFKELSERFLVICLSRTLSFCQQHGVTPDIVVQLDTHGEQQNFFSKEMDFSNTWLFALSCVPGRKYLNRFRGVFWIDAFEPRAYGSNYEIRNSWLSSLIPMLGVAELFSPPKLLIAGADLAYRTARYFNEKGEERDVPNSLSNRAQVEAVSWEPFPVCLNDGSVGETTPQFFAVAFEAETVASELLHKGTLSFNLTRGGILDEDVFPYGDPASFKSGPKIERDALYRVMELRSKNGVLPDEKIVKAILHERQKQVAPLVRDIEGLAATVDAAELVDHPLLSAGKLLSQLHPVKDPESQVYLAKKVLQRYQEILQERTIYYRLKDWVSMKKTVPVYCLSGELSFVVEALRSLFPGGKWEFRTSWGSTLDERATLFKVAELPSALKVTPVSLMSRAYFEGVDYLLPYLKENNYLIIEDVVEAGWPSIA